MVIYLVRRKCRAYKIIKLKQILLQFQSEVKIIRCV